MDYVKPAEVVATMVEVGATKAQLPIRDLLIRGALSGAILGIATSLAITTAIQTHLPIIGAVLFPVGFVMIVLLGLELVTGNFALLPVAYMAGRTDIKGVIRNCSWVFLGNLIGSLCYAVLLWAALTMSGSIPAGGIATKITAIAEAKTIHYAPHGFAGLITAFVKGMLCNWMVTMGMVMVMGLVARSAMSKILAAWLPIMIFFAHGFEHAVVNMFVIPAGMLFGAKVTLGDWWLWNTEQKLGFSLRRVPAELCEPRGPVRRHGHLGMHLQSTPGLYYAGVSVPAGRMTTEQMEVLADIAEDCGAGEVRLTVWQNLILPHVPMERLDELVTRLARIGFGVSAPGLTGGLVACTGNTGCRFAATNTKSQALELGRYLQAHVDLDEPINIHLTGCPHSCAQHYVGDIGLLGAQVETDAGSVEGYHVYIGGGVDQDQGLAREYATAVPFDELPRLIEQLLTVYREQRSEDDTFITFVRRHTVEDLQTMAETAA